MESEILYQFSYSSARVRLNAEKAITAEAGAVVSMPEGITIQTEVKGGLLAGHSGLKSNFLRPDLVPRLRELLSKQHQP